MSDHHTLAGGHPKSAGAVRWGSNVRFISAQLLHPWYFQLGLCAEISARGVEDLHAGFDFGLLSLVTFFGGAKKVTPTEGVDRVLPLRISGRLLS
jgi:hypothetical protein